MLRRSITLEIIPSTDDIAMCQVLVKTIDWDGTQWVDAKTHISTHIVEPADDLAFEDVLKWAGLMAHRIGRIVETEQEREAIGIVRIPNPHVSEASETLTDG